MTIKETVKQWQNFIAAVGLFHSAYGQYPPVTWHEPTPITAEQSLGELCIELAQDTLMKKKAWIFRRFGFGDTRLDVCMGADYKENLDSLRRAMYHRASAGPMFAKGDGDSRETK